MLFTKPCNESEKIFLILINILILFFMTFLCRNKSLINGKRSEHFGNRNWVTICSQNTLRKILV